MIACKYSSSFFENAAWKQFHNLNYNMGSLVWKKSSSVSKTGNTVTGKTVYDALNILYHMGDPCNFLYEQYWESVFTKSTG